MSLTSTAAHRKDVGKIASMEHRHFATIATIISGMTGEDFEGLKDVIARHFANELSCTNPRFDRNRFLRACGVA